MARVRAYSAVWRSAGRSPSADRSRLDQPLVEGRGGGDRPPGVPFEPVGAAAFPIRTDPRPSNPSFASGNVGRLPDEDFCADLDAVVEVDHVGVVEAKAARRNGVPDRLRLVGSVDAEDGVTEIEGSRPEGIARTPRHEPRQIGLPSDHFRWGAPVWPLLFLGHPLDARPLETDAPDADAIADGPIVRLDEVEIALARIDDDRSGRLARMERHDLPRIGIVRLLLVRGSLLRWLALDTFNAICCATAIVPESEDARPATATASPPRNTRHDMETIKLSRFPPRLRRSTCD